MRAAATTLAACGVGYITPVSAEGRARVESRARWTPVGTYASLTAFLLAIGVGASAIFHVTEHEAIPWSTLPIAAQHFAIAVEGVGLSAALVIAAMLLIAYRMFDIRAELARPTHLALAVVAVPAIAAHGSLAIAHVTSIPAEPAHVGLVVLGVAAALVVGALAVSGLLRDRPLMGAAPRVAHARLAIALAVIGSAHIVVAAAHSAMHNSFV